MRILILDDSKLRHRSFQRAYIGNEEVVSVYRYSEFLEQLERGKWDLVHLDHDLGDDVEDPDVYLDGWGIARMYDGGHAAQRVCELPDELKPDRAVVHSVNSSEAPGMVAALRKAGVPCTWEPFGDESRELA